MVKHVYLRGGVYQFHLRIPQQLHKFYGKSLIRKSLATSEPKEAAKKAEELTKRYKAEFRVLAGGQSITPSDIVAAGRALASEYDLEHFVDHVVEPAFHRHAKGLSDEAYDLDWQHLPYEMYLLPHQIEALHILQHPDRFRLSDALNLYFATHKKGDEPAFVKKTGRDWQMLIAYAGDIEFTALNRANARAFVEELLDKGYMTATIRKTLNICRAVYNVCLTEREISKTNPFANLTIRSEGKDAKPKLVANSTQINEIAAEFTALLTTAMPIIILLQMELGTRIGEVAGLSIDDVQLDAETPYVHFRDHPWRTLKTDESNRRVPLVGLALIAAKAALALPRNGKGLFEQYARERGNDTASASANKRLKKWGLTSHAFRHAMKDRLREAGCPKDIRDAIQGHSNRDVADNYGQGHTLQTMKLWLEKVMVKL